MQLAGQHLKGKDRAQLPKLTDALAARVVAITQTAQPYFVLDEKGIATPQKVSFVRGRILAELIVNGYDVQTGVFIASDLRNLTLAPNRPGVVVVRADISGSDLRQAKLGRQI